MKRSEFHYDLPERLIAQQPLAQRASSRLLKLERSSGEFADCRFRDLSALLEPGDLLVFNDTRVIPARLFALKATGGKVEILVERVLDSHHCTAQLRASKPTRAGALLQLGDGVTLEVAGQEGDFFRLRSAGQPLAEVFKRFGHTPLPRYIRRQDTAADTERYQTVYADHPGAVAAPTAGLHFDRELLAALDERGVRRVCVTLHVGAGTFQPVRCEIIEDHRMHAEYLQVSAAVCEAVRETRVSGRRVIAVGTTSVRSLETAATDGELKPFQGDTRLFIHPGYRFRVVDAIITNFHLPESTLLMLVSAFAGREAICRAYAHAIRQEYRFFSYGDAMIIL